MKLAQDFSVITLEKKINELRQNPNLLNQEDYQQVVKEIIQALGMGKLRVASPNQGQWQVNSWVKEAVLFYFKITKMQEMQVGPFTFYDKIPLKNDYAQTNVRAVPPAIVRVGSFLAPNVVLMPSYVNIGAYIDEGTMVDTWATVGSCAQIGKNVHISGGVGIGGVLEPVQASPVIIEDNVFLGSRAIVVEGVIVEEEAVLGANVVITASTKIINVNTGENYIGRIPRRSVVIPGAYNKQFKTGTFAVPCALIIGERKESTDRKVSLNQALREFEVSV